MVKLYAFKLLITNVLSGGYIDSQVRLKNAPEGLYVDEKGIVVKVLKEVDER